MVGHAGRAIDDAHFFFTSVFPRCVVDYVADLRKAGWLEPVSSPNRYELRSQNQSNGAVGRKKLRLERFRHIKLRHEFLLHGDYRF